MRHHVKRTGWIAVASAAAIAAATCQGSANAQDQMPGKDVEQPASIQGWIGPLGDPGGVRAFLDARGLDFSFVYIGEVLGNAIGGVKRGATFEGRIDAQADADLEKLAGLKGAALHAQAFQIQGRGLTGNNLLDLFTVSNIEAFPDVKLYEAWYEQKLWGDRIFVRMGQLAADTEFLVSQSASFFVDSSLGWPAILFNSLPSGGPAFPFATPGARIRVVPSDRVALMAAVFNGDPTGAYQPGVGNNFVTLRDFGGTAFRVQDPPLVIGEVQYAYIQDKNSGSLPGTIKLGYLHHFESFGALDRGPGSTVTYRGDNSVYGVIDQRLYQAHDSPSQAIAAFVRTVYAPADRNLFDVYVDGGIVISGFVPGRANDAFGLSAAYGHISHYVSANDAVIQPALIRDFQATLEASYQFALAAGLTVQPDIQYIFHPGAHGIADPQTGLPVRDALVLGLRTTIRY